MTKNIPSITVATSHFSDLYTLANTLVQVLANEIVTANSAPGGGAMTAGNGFVTGIFGANTIVGTTLQGGNVTSTSVIWMGSNLNMNTQTFISGNVVVNNTIVEVGANVVLNTSAVALGANVTLTQVSLELGNTIANVFANSIIHIVANATSQTVTTPSSLSLGTAAANAFINTIALFIGNSSVNAVINSTGFYYDGIPFTVGTPGAVGSNTNIQFDDSGVFNGTNAFSFIKTSNTVTIQNNFSIGNSSVNATQNSTSITVGAAVVNTSGLQVGANVVANTTAFYVGNSIAGTFANSIVKSIANSTAQTTILPVSVVVANSVTTTSMNLQSIAIGNTTANATVNTTGFFLDGTALSTASMVAFNAYTSTQTVTIPAGATRAWVRMVGGGGGVNHGYTDGAAGGSGGYLEKLLTGLTPGNTLALVVGAGAIASSATAATASTLSSGTQTISTLTANPGALYGGGYGSSGGTAIGGDYNLTGEAGYGLIFYAGDGTGSTFGGVGGSNPLGTGGLINSPGTGYGSGGAGNGINQNGQPGICLINWYG